MSLVRVNDIAMYYETHAEGEPLALIPHGRGDRSAPYQLAEEMYAGIANSRMLTYPGGQIFFVFRPQQLIDAVTAFVRTV